MVRVRIRLGGGVGGSVPVATTDPVHSTCIELQLAHATTSRLRLRLRFRLGRGSGWLGRGVGGSVLVAMTA